MKIDWNLEHPDQALLIMERSEFEKEHPELLARSALLQEGANIEFCKVMLFQGELSGTFLIPQKSCPIKDKFSLDIVLYGQSLYFIADADNLKKIEKIVKTFVNRFDMNVRNPFEFLLRFLNYLVEEDVYFLEKYNEKLEDIEENIFEGRGKGMERFIMTTRKDMNILDNYYLQMSAVGRNIQEAVIATATSENDALISVFMARVSQLLNMVGSIKDYTSQIWNLRQTQLSDKQNKISTLLTIVTAIFLPLTLITGWFGMNFDNIPLEHQKSGYYIIVGICVVIVALELLYLKKQRWLNMDRDTDKL